MKVLPLLLLVLAALMFGWAVSAPMPAAVGGEYVKTPVVLL